MPTNILNTIVPDYPIRNGNPEVCHVFTGNFIIRRNNADAPGNYVMPNHGDSHEFILNLLANNHYHQHEQINPGDIILMYENGVLTHSMVAVNEHIWFGVNNIQTFGPWFVQQRIPIDTLPLRREIDINLVALEGYNQETHRFMVLDRVFEVAIYGQN